MSPETIIQEAAIEKNLKQFLLVLSVSLSVATLLRIFSWFRCFLFFRQRING
jgi:CPA1 family monovalent cation:H+ antiporter